MNTLGAVTFQCFTHEQVKEINKEVKKNILRKEELSKASSAVSKIGAFSIVPCSPLMDLLHPWMYQCQGTNIEFFGYDIYWDFHLETFNYNVYGESGEYGWHVDSKRGQTPVDIKLTCMLNLSEDPYEGGEFHMITSDEEIKFTSGMGVIFTSLVAHKVTPVTKEERITLSYWAQGPSWR